MAHQGKMYCDGLYCVWGACCRMTIATPPPSAGTSIGRGRCGAASLSSSPRSPCPRRSPGCSTRPSSPPSFSTAVRPGPSRPTTSAPWKDFMLRRRATSRTRPTKRGETWVYPKFVSFLRAARGQTIAEYIAARRQTILRTIADRHILEEYRGAERRQGSPPRLYLWEQEVEEELPSEEEEEKEGVFAG